MTFNIILCIIFQNAIYEINLYTCTLISGLKQSIILTNTNIRTTSQVFYYVSFFPFSLFNKPVACLECHICRFYLAHAQCICNRVSELFNVSIDQSTRTDLGASLCY